MKKIALIALVISILFISCENGNGNGGGGFNSSTNETLSNNIATLGLIGTSASSSNTSVATVVSPPIEKIKITSVAEGSAVITVSAGANNATINVTVSKTGSMIIGAIEKYLEKNQSPYAGTWVSNQFPAQMIIEGTTSLTATLQFTNASPPVNAGKGTLVIDGNDATLTYTHVWKNNAWTDDVLELESAFGAEGVLGEENPMTGTVTGSSAGSIIFEHLVKQ
jgi:hypothetical protein